MREKKREFEAEIAREGGSLHVKSDIPEVPLSADDLRFLDAATREVAPLKDDPFLLHFKVAEPQVYRREE